MVCCTFMIILLILRSTFHFEHVFVGLNILPNHFAPIVFNIIPMEGSDQRLCPPLDHAPTPLPLSPLSPPREEWTRKRPDITTVTSVGRASVIQET